MKFSNLSWWFLGLAVLWGGCVLASDLPCTQDSDCTGKHICFRSGQCVPSWWVASLDAPSEISAEEARGDASSPPETSKPDVSESKPESSPEPKAEAAEREPTLEIAPEPTPEPTKETSCPVSSCTVGKQRACYDGSSTTKDVGVCRSGTQICAATSNGCGEWKACQGQVLPGQEGCSGSDDDCNGIVDEGCVVTLAGSGKEGKTDGPAGQAEFYFPEGLFVGFAGSVFVAEQGNHRIRKIDPAGVVTTVAGSARGFADGKQDRAQFNFPVAIALAANGDLYIADFGNHAIRKIDSLGEVSTFAGGMGGGLKNGPRASSLFVSPQGLAIDSKGNVFVADTGNNIIRKIDTSGMVTTFCGHPAGGFDDAGTGSVGTGTLRSPGQMVIDSKDYLYVVDAGNSAIRIIDPQGNALTLAGSGKSGYKDAQGKQAEFSNITGIALDPKGNVYVADSGSFRIRKIDPLGNVTTIAGIGTKFFRDGPFTSAAFSNLGGLFFSGNKLYISDAGNARIRQMIFP